MRCSRSSARPEPCKTATSRCLNGLHTDINLETALAMRYHRNAKMLSVGLSRKLRANSELRALIPDLSIVSATPAGMPVAYGLCEALRARQVYWAEKDGRDVPMRFRQFLEPVEGEKVVLVDDLLRSGMLLTEARQLLESRGAQVVALAVLVYQPTPQTRSFGSLPLYYLAKLDATYYADAAACQFCRSHVPLHQVSMVRDVQEHEELVTASPL